MHDVRSDRSYVPAGQVEQLVRELVSCFPAAQLVHELCPVFRWYLPAAQVEQELDPEPAENFPAAQVLPEVPVWRGEDWYVPAAQDVQLLRMLQLRVKEPLPLDEYASMVK